MKNELVVKDNALINASYNLETVEQRLIMLAIINAREMQLGITADTKLTIHASQYAKQFKVSTDAAYKALREAVNNLFERKFSYIAEYKRSGKTGIVRSRWVSRIFYVDELAILEMTFAPDVIPFITRLEENFTTYQLGQVSDLTGKYAIRLYELVISWKKTGKVPPIDLNRFRNCLGVEENEYQRMHHFKNRVLDPAIKQINEHTDIVASYEQHKCGRTITGFSFTFKQKNPHTVPSGSLKNKKVVDTPINLTEKQIPFFAHKLAYDNSFASQYAEVGEEYADLERRLIQNLTDQEFVKKISDDLIRLGFKA